jgi:hypothetical protein
MVAGISIGSTDVQDGNLCMSERTAGQLLRGPDSLAPIDSLRASRAGLPSARAPIQSAVRRQSAANVTPQPEDKIISSLHPEPQSPILGAVKRVVEKTTDAAKVARSSGIIKALNDATEAVRSQRSKLRRSKINLQHGGLRRMSRRWSMRRNLMPFYLKDAPGAKMDVHYGAVARLPVDTRRILNTMWLPQKSRAAVPTEEGFGCSLAASSAVPSGAFLFFLQLFSWHKGFGLSAVDAR